MAVYSELCLNETITDFGSRYNFLAVEYDKRQKERSKKIGMKNGVGKRDREKVTGSKYSLASNLGVLSVEC
jgi:ABC-type Na+ transport system ATPase subunit NatA